MFVYILKLKRDCYKKPCHYFALQGALFGPEFHGFTEKESLAFPIAAGPVGLSSEAA